MAANKYLNKKTALVAGGLVAAYLIYRQSTKAKDGMPEGSLGGEDELSDDYLGGQQGFDIDPNNSIPRDYLPQEPFYMVEPDGSVSPSPSPTGRTPSAGGASGIPSGSTPTYSSGSGSLVSDAAVLGGALGFNLLLPNLGKGVKGALDSKYKFKSSGDLASESNFQKWLKDPYNVGESGASKVLRKGSEGAAEVAQAGQRPLLKEAGAQALQTAPKWAKGVKGVANFIPVLDIPIGAGLDVYFSKYEEDKSKRIDWATAFKGNLIGEGAQLGVTGAGAVAGVGVGAVPGFIIGTGADIAATEAYYKSKGKSSIFDFGSSNTPMPTQYNINTTGQTTGASNKSAPQIDLSNVAYSVPVPSSSGGLSKSSASSASRSKTSTALSSSNKTVSPQNYSSVNQNYSPNVTPSTSTSSSAKSSASRLSSPVSTVTKTYSTAANTAKTTVQSVAARAQEASRSVVSKIKSISRKKK